MPPSLPVALHRLASRDQFARYLHLVPDLGSGHIVAFLKDGNLCADCRSHVRSFEIVRARESQGIFVDPTCEPRYGLVGIRCLYGCDVAVREFPVNHCDLLVL